MLKFRVFDKRYNTYLSPIKRDNMLWNALNSTAYLFTNKYYILELCTGLQDKNGKDIYVGDIVRINHTLFVVEFNSNAAQYELKNKDLTLTFWNVDREDREVIGNINENKELLEDDYI